MKVLLASKNKGVFNLWKSILLFILLSYLIWKTKTSQKL